MRKLFSGFTLLPFFLEIGVNVFMKHHIGAMNLSEKEVYSFGWDGRCA